MDGVYEHREEGKTNDLGYSGWQLGHADKRGKSGVILRGFMSNSTMQFGDFYMALDGARLRNVRHVGPLMLTVLAGRRAEDVIYVMFAEAAAMRELGKV